MSYAPIACTIKRNASAPTTTLAVVPHPDSQRPVGAVVAAAGSLVTGLALIGLAGAALSAGHGEFSGGVAVALIVYGAAMVAGAWGLWQLSVFGRGPIVAMALFNLIAGYTDRKSVV